MNRTQLKLMSGLCSILCCSLVSFQLQAGPLDPNCDPEKIAKNAAVKATVGVSGRCTPEKAAERKVDDAKDAVGDAKDNVGDKVDSLKPEESLKDKAVDSVKPEKKEVKDATKVVKKVIN
ncbi:hypothetical protein [Shewanella acanthi]|uniref:hypothetical protein n=1 Tax=Shewanella acanthi TaxID=2864212 RepID=UPI001C65FE02|nr:hypothetical protein [Shewanella acanthi]QYJ78416.1 hypothetical protein K0H61_15145 [Shewanella acanthi]